MTPDPRELADLDEVDEAFVTTHAALVEEGTAGGFSGRFAVELWAGDVGRFLQLDSEADVACLVRALPDLCRCYWQDAGGEAASVAMMERCRTIAIEHLTTERGGRAAARAWSSTRARSVGLGRRGPSLSGRAATGFSFRDRRSRLAVGGRKRERTGAAGVGPVPMSTSKKKARRRARSKARRSPA